MIVLCFVGTGKGSIRLVQIWRVRCFCGGVHIPTCLVTLSYRTFWLSKMAVRPPPLTEGCCGCFPITTVSVFVFWHWSDFYPPSPRWVRQVQNQIYLLDFQKLEGDPFGFMTLCAKVFKSKHCNRMTGCNRRTAFFCWTVVVGVVVATHYRLYATLALLGTWHVSPSSVTRGFWLVVRCVTQIVANSNNPECDQIYPQSELPFAFKSSW